MHAGGMREADENKSASTGAEFCRGGLTRTARLPDTVGVRLPPAMAALPNLLLPSAPTPPAPGFGFFYGFYFFAPSTEATPA